METNLEVLNKISAKLGGSADATSVTESLNNIANALGDTNPDVIKSVSDSLNDILEYAGQGGGGGLTLNGKMSIKFVNNSSTAILPKTTGNENIVLLDGESLRSGDDLFDNIISPNESKSKTYYLIVHNDGENDIWDFGANNIVDHNPSDTISISLSDAVNCSVDGLNVVTLIDPSTESSITLTITDGL